MIVKDKIIETIKTGDLLLFTKVSTKSKWVRYFSASRYSHIALAVRIVTTGNSFRVTKTDGEIYVLDMIGNELDYDIISDTIKGDLRLTPLANRLDKDYNLITVRSLKDVNLVDCDKAYDFIMKHRDIKFMSGFGMIELWLDFPFREHNYEERGYACTMVTCKFMREVCGIPVNINIISPAFGYGECHSENSRFEINGSNAELINYYYEPDETILIKHEEWYQAIGLLLIFLVIWLLFWYFTSDRYFG